ncbi:MAG: hypothetical protein AABX33_09235 [Nanoarchaeota archaeon]
MIEVPDLERRALGLTNRFRNSLEEFMPEFRDAGYRGDVAYLLNTSNYPGDLRPSPFYDLLREFYTGVFKRIIEEKDLFESAFIYLTTLPGFIPIENHAKALESTTKSMRISEESYLELMLHNPEILAKQGPRFGISSDNLARDILNHAGAYLLYELSLQGERKTNYTKIVQEFKQILDNVIKIGKILPEGSTLPENCPNPIELLKVVSQNAEKFVRRYAALCGYDMSAN